MTLPTESRLGAAEHAAAEQVRAYAVTPAASIGDVPITEGPPGASMQPTHVWIGALTTDVEQTWELTGPEGSSPAQRREVFDVVVNVYVHHESDDYVRLRDRMAELVLEVEAALLEDTTLGGTVYDATLAGYKREHGFSENGRAMWTAIRLECEAYLA